MLCTSNKKSKKIKTSSNKAKSHKCGKTGSQINNLNNINFFKKIFHGFFDVCLKRKVVLFISFNLFFGIILDNFASLSFDDIDANDDIPEIENFEFNEGTVDLDIVDSLD